MKDVLLHLNGEGTVAISRDEEIELVEAMRCYGSGFSGCIADAWARADLENLAKLRVTFGAMLWGYRTFTEAARGS